VPHDRYSTIVRVDRSVRVLVLGAGGEGAEVRWSDHGHAHDSAVPGNELRHEQAVVVKGLVGQRWLEHCLSRMAVSQVAYLGKEKAGIIA
jgi:hypothetical protein